MKKSLLWERMPSKKLRWQLRQDHQERSAISPKNKSKTPLLRVPYCSTAATSTWCTPAAAIKLVLRKCTSKMLTSFMFRKGQQPSSLVEPLLIPNPPPPEKFVE